MSRPRKTATSSRGKGVCGSPGCQEPKAPDHFLCRFHVRLITKFKEDLERDSTSMFLRRNIEEGDRTPSRIPTCCAIGCFEPRVPPQSYCFAHEELEGSFID